MNTFQQLLHLRIPSLQAQKRKLMSPKHLAAALSSTAGSPAKAKPRMNTKMRRKSL
jgi:hypothetical protein